MRHCFGQFKVLNKVLDGSEKGFWQGISTRCSVPESHGALLDSYQEDALWQQVFMAQPAQHREFEPSSKRRKSRRANLPLDTD